MSDVTLTPSGPPETVLEDADPAILAAIAAADSAALRAEVVAGNPTSLEAWAALGAAVEALGEGGPGSFVEAYAYYRVGYHRGLDLLRKSGWRGSGYVRWRYESNRGFLACLEGLMRTAAAIGEADEEERCREFLAMLDPERFGQNTG
ncbi:MAG: DUF3151 domain-containing protein [Acidimicrobiia bacterium]|nr:DUF3151 domain-containing protein [Acidimicrobiia bacterium]MDH4308939.1 DUF3151 domain-containing protein [Acidimicrobiia bacterium]MDH5292958.1 DUF3151 domain-containing protein [Acidimicrobiia bacterium]